MNTKHIDHENPNTIPKILKKINPNYVTAHFGKWHIDVDPKILGCISYPKILMYSTTLMNLKVDAGMRVPTPLKQVKDYGIGLRLTAKRLDTATLWRSVATAVRQSAVPSASGRALLVENSIFG